MRVLFADTLLGRLNFQPLGLLSLAAVCRDAGHVVRLADLTVPRQVEEIVGEFAPDVIGFPAITGSHRISLDLCRRLKARFRFLAVFGGPHATFFPETARLDGVDALCRGEGERSFTDYLKRLEDGDEPERTSNFVFGVPEGIIDNPPAPLIDDLDLLPFGAWEILDEHTIASRFPVKPFMASRGCPYNCTFCYVPALRGFYRGKGNLLRRYSPSRFVEEVAAYKNSGRPLSFVYVFDDAFPTDRPWLEEFCERYRRDVGLPFFVNLTADRVDGSTVERLRGAGLAYMGIGLESGDEEVRRKVMRKQVTDEDLRRTAGLLREAGIPFEFYSMLAIPDTTLGHDLKTLSMNVDLRPTVPEVMVYQPYPGTPLGDEAKKLGLFSGNPDELPVTFKSRTILKIPHAKAVRRLFLLFRFLVAVGASRRMAVMLVQLPLTPLYWLINRLVEGYVKSRRIYKIKVSFTDYVKILYHYLKS